MTHLKQNFCKQRRDSIILCCDFAQKLTILFTMLCVFVIIICSESLPDRLKTLKVEVLEKHRGEIKVCCDSALHYNKKYIENNTWSRGDMEFIFECSHRYRTSEHSERVRYQM